MNARNGDKVILNNNISPGFFTVKKGTKGVVINANYGILSDSVEIKFDGVDKPVNMSGSDFQRNVTII